MTNVRQMSPEQLTAFHADAEGRVATFKYEHPKSERVKEVKILARSKRIIGLLQVVRDGGENNLHYHTNSDTIWMVLRGHARFYGPGDKVIGELGPEEGILMPEGARYWFEKVGEVDLEIMQFIGNGVAGEKDERINVDQHKDWMEDFKEVDLTVY